MTPRRDKPKNEVDEASEESFPASDPPAYMGSGTVAGAPEHGPGRHPVKHGEIHEVHRVVNLNTASQEVLGSLPALNPPMVRALMERRPFRDWSEVERLPGFGAQAVEKLKAGGAELG